jgi:hypothetical protein
MLKSLCLIVLLVVAWVLLIRPVHLQHKNMHLIFSSHLDKDELTTLQRQLETIVGPVKHTGSHIHHIVEASYLSPFEITAEGRFYKGDIILIDDEAHCIMDVKA